MTARVMGTKTPTNKHLSGSDLAELQIEPEKLDPRNFRAWPRDQQISYIEAKGIGVPKSLQLGQFGVKATLASDRSLSLRFLSGAAPADTGTRRPATAAELDMLPGALPTDVFLAWNDADRLDYVIRHGAGDNSIVEIGNPPQLTASILPEVIIEERPASHAVSKRQAWKAPSTSWPYDLNPPPEFSVDPSTLKTESQISDFVKSFDRWFSGYWVQYVEKYGRDGVLNIPVNGKPVRTAVVSTTDPQNVFIVQRMNQMDFASLTYSDQARIAKTKAFDQVKQSFGFERASEARFDGKRFNDYVDEVVDEVISKELVMGQEDLQPYLNQLEIIRGQVNQQEIVKPSVIGKRISDIKDAFDRAFQFANIMPEKYEPGSHGIEHYSNVISLDGGAAVVRGYQIFIQTDQEIASTQARLTALTRDARNRDPSQLIMEIMRLNQNITNAKELRESEELKQRDDLLQTYAAMQDAVNETLRQFGEEEEGETKKVTFCGKESYADLSDRQKKLVSMFSTLFGKDGQLHPLEASNSISRPLMDLVEDGFGVNVTPQGLGYEASYPLVAFTNAQWNTFSTQLSEIVTLLGQNTQMKMNEITTIRQLGTSQFEMATKAMSKAADLIAMIGRNM